MKYFLSFIAGVVVTVVVLVGIGIYKNINEGNIYGLTFLSENQVGQEFDYKSIKILQTHSQNTALVVPNKEYTFEPVMFLLGNETDSFYDNQVINVPKKCKLVQVGTYQYENREKIYRTVPAVMIVKNSY